MVVEGGQAQRRLAQVDVIAAVGLMRRQGGPPAQRHIDLERRRVGRCGGNMAHPVGKFVAEHPVRKPLRQGDLDVVGGNDLAGGDLLAGVQPYTGDSAAAHQ